MRRTPKYQVVSRIRDLRQVIARCRKLGPTALDFETTSLRPADGRVRLVSLCNKKVRVVVDFDKICGGFQKCAPLFEGVEWVVFNAGFERRWFIAAGAPSVQCSDVGFLRRAILGGGHFSLKSAVMWDLDVVLDKEEQLSDWGAKVLTKDQLNYAFLDAHWTYQLWLHWAQQADEGHWGGFRMMNDMVPAVIEMEEAGVKIDTAVHGRLVANWEKVRDDKLGTIRAMVSEDEVANVNSNSQWGDYFAARMPDGYLDAWPRTEKTGQLSMKTSVLRSVAGLAPGTPLETFLDTLADYKTISKYLSSFGDTIINMAKMRPDGRIHPRYNIGAAKTCRFSSSGPNIQQIPRDRELLGTMTSVRTSFIADLGRKLVSLDYSGIELRVLALLSGDEQLLEDMVEGDVHAEVGSYMVGKRITKKTRAGKAARQAAKPVSFLIVYGGSAAGLATSTRCSMRKAQDLIGFWRDRYPKAFALRHDALEEATQTRFIRMADGGTIYMGKRPDLPKCANYPVQRAALTVMAKAITRHKAHLDDLRSQGQQKMTRMLGTIHDALIDEAATRDAKRCLKIMEEDMVNGFLDVFPGASTARLVEGGIGPNWGELE